MKKRGKRLLRVWVNLHLEILHDRMKSEFNVEANVGKPQVSYKETITIPSKLKPNLSNSLVVVVNMLTLNLKLNRMKKVKATRSSARLWAVLFQRIYHQQLKGSKKDWQQGFWQALILSMLKSLLFLDLTTR